MIPRGRLGLLLALPLVACLGRARLPAPSVPLARMERAAFPAAPAFAPEPLADLPTVKSATLENGLTLLVVEHRDAADVAVRYVMANGAEDGRLHDMGVPSFALRVALADPAAESAPTDELVLRGYSAHEGASVSARVPRSDLEAAIARIGKLAAHPPSSDAHVRAAIFERLELVERDRFVARVLAESHAKHLLFGAEHPLGQSVRGSAERIGRLQVGEIERAQRAQFAPDASALVVAGPVSLEEVTRLAERHLGPLRAERTPLVPPWTLHPVGHARGVLAPGTSAHVAVAFAAPPAGHRDAVGFAALSVLAGELQGSRIPKVLRVRDAYTYHVSAHYRPLRDAGVFSLSLSVMPGQLYKVLTSLEEALDGLGRTPADPGELARVKVQLRERRRAALAEPDTSADLAEDAFLTQGLRDAAGLTQAWDRYFAQVDALSAEELRSLAARYLPMAAGALAVAGHLWEFDRGLSHWDRHAERLMPADVAARLAREGIITLE